MIFNFSSWLFTAKTFIYDIIIYRKNINISSIFNVHMNVTEQYGTEFLQKAF